MLLIQFGVSYENRTHDSGITTRGFATKLTSPYRNTLLISGYRYDILGLLPYSQATHKLATVCFYMVRPEGTAPS